MIRDIRTKLVKISNHMPIKKETVEYFEKVEQETWLYQNLKLEGSNITMDQVKAMIAGDFLINVSVGDYLAKDKLLDLLAAIRKNAGGAYETLGASSNKVVELDLYVLEKIAGLVLGNPNPAYRKKTELVDEYSYVPPLSSEIPLEMANLGNLLREATAKEARTDECFSMCAQIHNRILEIYPLEENNGIFARAVSAYYLATKGYPVTIPQIKEEEYNKMFADYLNTGDSTPIKEAYLKEVSDILDTMVQLTI